MLLPGSIVDEDVIQIYKHKGVCEQTQDIIHHPHEHHWSISQSKRHDQPLKNAFFRLEGCFPYITFLDWDMAVSRIYINLDEILYKNP